MSTDQTTDQKCPTCGRSLEGDTALADLVRSREDEQIEMLHDYWASLWKNNDPGTFPWTSTLRSALRSFTTAAIKDAMELAADRRPTSPRGACSYFGAVLRHWRDEEAGVMDTTNTLAPVGN